MNSESKIENQVCEHCGARSHSDDKKCWLCSEDKSATNPYGISSVDVNTSEAIDQANETKSMLLVLFIFCSLLAIFIFIGIRLDGVQMYFPYILLVLPALLITFLQSLAFGSKKSALQVISLVSTFIISLVCTVALVILFALSALFLMFINCFKALGMTVL